MTEEDDTPGDGSDDDEPGSDVGDMGDSFALDMDMDMDTDQDLYHSQRQGAPNSLPSTSPSLGLIDPIVIPRHFSPALCQELNRSHTLFSTTEGVTHKGK